MKKLLVLLGVLLVVGPALAQQEIKSKAGSPAKNDPSKPRGLKGASPAVQRAAVPKLGVTETIPTELAMIPERLSMWGNNKYGLCVTTEEVCAKMAWARLCGVKIWITEEECIRWAQAHGILNGAYLTQTLNAMQKDPLVDDQGRKWLNGGYVEVDYSKDANLKSGLAVGPLKIAIDADALPSDAGDRQGWFAMGKKNYPNTDHCIPLLGYGSAKFLFEKLGLPLPAAIKPDQPGYLAFTWSTIGFVDKAWLDGTCVESYVRNPTTVGMSPAPLPPPPPPPPPQPPVGKKVELVVDGKVVFTMTTEGPGPAPSLKDQLTATGITPAEVDTILRLIAFWLSTKQSSQTFEAKPGAPFGDVVCENGVCSLRPSAGSEPQPARLAGFLLRPVDILGSARQALFPNKPVRGFIGRVIGR